MLLKPQPRAKKPRKPLARSPLKRSGNVIKRGKAPAQQRRTDPAKAKRDLDRLASEVIRIYDPICAACTRRPSTDAMHMIPRTYSGTRWLVMNLRGGCRDCHTLLTGMPTLWKQIWTEWLGESRVSELDMLSRYSGKIDLEAVKANLLIEKDRALNGGRIDYGYSPSRDVFLEVAFPDTEYGPGRGGTDRPAIQSRTA